MAFAAGVFSARAGSNLFFLSAPQSEIFTDSLVRILVTTNPPTAKPPDSCDLFHSPIPVGNKLEGHGVRILAKQSISKDSASILFEFKASDNDSGKSGPQLGLGFHYAVASCRDGKFISPEIPLWVVSRQAVSITSPKAQETSSSPNIAWTPVPGVPAYHLLLSDQALDINTEKGTVSGASVIWQAITTKTSIAYGTPDPSGNFSKVPAPPLSPNVPYNLVILNNYDGRSTLATSTKAQGLKLFTLQASGPVLKPARNLEPAQNAILTSSRDSAIAFKWSKAAASTGAGAANTYQVFVYSLESQDAVDVLFPIWHTEVTDTFAVLDAKRTLLSKRYVWKVFALSESGASVVGDTTSFLYRNDVQTLSLTVKSAGLEGDTLPLSDVQVSVTPLDGSADPLPLFTNNTGGAEKVLAVGSYSLGFSKNGYAGQTRTVTLGLSAPVNILQILPASSCRITGHVVDQAGADLVNVNVTAAGGGGKTVQGVSDAQGFFLLGVAPGTHSVSFSKPDFQSRPDTTVVLAAGKSADLGRLALAKAQGSLSGTVANDKGALMAGCQITVKNASGAVERNLLTDDKGVFSAFLAPGTYTVIAARTGFTSQQKTAQLTESAQLGFILPSGASLVKGRISLLSWPTGAVQQSSPLPGAIVELINPARGIPQKTEADLRGEYSLSADTGTYLLKASRPGKALPESAVVRIVAPRSTVNQDLSLLGFASILGTIRISPDTVADPSAVSVNLFSSAGLSLLATATPQRAPEAGAAGAMTYSLDGVPDGTYRLACGLPGYGLDAEPVITIRDAIWKTGQDLMLKKAIKSITFAVTVGGKSAEGLIRLITPQAAEIPAGRKLTEAAAGTYILNAAPDSTPWIPLTRYSFFLPAAGSADTTLSLGFPFSHRSGPISFRNGEAELVLDAQAKIDSMRIIYGYGAPADTFRVPASQLIGPPGTRKIRFRPGLQGGLLTYFFIIHSGSLTYSNDEAARRFRAQVESPVDLAILKLGTGDSLRLPAHTRGEIHLHAYDAAGRRLDSAVDERGTFAWSVDASLGVKLDKHSKRTLTYLTDAPSSALGKRGAHAAAAWDTLTVTVGLDGMEQTLRLPTKVVSAVINKLVLSSTLGETADIPDPSSFGLFVSGFDTTTSPPTPVVPNPVVTLVPPQAGTVRELQVDLDRRFIGPVRILARQINADGSEAATELGAYRDSLTRGLNVGQTLTLGDTTRRLFHDPAFEMYVPDSAFSGPPQALLRLNTRNVAKTFSSGITYAVSGNLYEISNPSGVAFAKRPRLTLGLPTAAGDRKTSLERFDLADLDWKAMADSVSADTNSFGAPALSADMREMDGSYYGLLTASQGLTAGEVQVMPNPFSPLVLAARDGNTQYGARIRLHPESDRSAEVTVSVKIYNLDGELVRLLVDHKTVPKATVDFYWDGKADGGRWARNGRYLLKVTVGTVGSTKQKQTIKSVVLFQ
ncbi:MAG: Carboxypeptidase regulatory-like protein [Fibrobacteres bacterium]|nr:Carboxypeptidase regulatory-like protein [Fibrobacterota bacterium]